MTIKDFIAKFKNHPVMFIGTGLSLRYLENAYSWDALLRKIALELNTNEEYYLDIKSKCMESNICSYDKVATLLEKDFNTYLEQNRTGKFKYINDIFYQKMRENIKVSRFKLYIAELMKELTFKEAFETELMELKKVRKNISSIITTNYDCMIENIFSSNPLIGNDILLSNPYGSVYKIHGCVSVPEKIIITEDDYREFDNKYKLINAQMLSLFIHNPIIFIGYSIGDTNIKEILKTIFSYVDYNSMDSKRIRDNFLLVVYEKTSMSTDVFEHDIDIEGFPTIRINKLKTDNFSALYQSLSSLMLPVSAMDIRKVQSVVKEIYSGGDIKVSITEDLDSLKNSDKVLVVGSKNTIKYEFQTISEIMINYFKIIEESNAQLLTLINKQKIQRSQYFPIYAFAKICPSITEIDTLKNQQQDKIASILSSISDYSRVEHKTPASVMSDEQITQSNKTGAIIYNIMNGTMDLVSVEKYLKQFDDNRSTEYRKILCAYDLKKYNND